MPMPYPHHLHPSRRQLAEWKRRSPAEKLAASHYSRAKRLHGGRPNGRWTARQWLALLESYDYRCAYCGRQLPPDELVPDHRRPLARGGVNSIANIVPACPQCNAAKGAKSEEEYAAYKARKEAA